MEETVEIGEKGPIISKKLSTTYEMSFKELKMVDLEPPHWRTITHEGKTYTPENCPFYYGVLKVDPNLINTVDGGGIPSQFVEK